VTSRVWRFGAANRIVVCRCMCNARTGTIQRYAGDDGGVRFHGVDIRDHVGIHESDVQGRHRDAVARIPHARRRSEPTARS
jgi:hypothetical protein